MGPDYGLGMRRLREALLRQSPRLPTEFQTLETRLQRNLAEARKYGASQNNQVDWVMIMEGLILLAHERAGLDFNELCRSDIPTGKLLHFPISQQAESKGVPMPSGEGIGHYDGTGKRWAVLVGVDSYADRSYGPLNVCVNDVKALSRQLAQGGFSPDSMQVLTGEPAGLCTRPAILEALESAARATQPEDLLLFYYSGHGDLADDEGYLVAHDGTFSNLKYTAVSIAEVIGIMRKAAARAKILMLDACHGGAAPGKGPRRMSEGFIQRVFKLSEGIAILSACKKDQRSYPMDGQPLSVFTYYLLEALQGKADHDDKGFVSVADVHRYVTDTVTQWSFQHKKPQQPTSQTEMVGEIVVCYYKRPD